MNESLSIVEIADDIAKTMKEGNLIQQQVKETCANCSGVSADRVRAAIEVLVATGRAAWQNLPLDGVPTDGPTFSLTDFTSTDCYVSTRHTSGCYGPEDRTKVYALRDGVADDATRQIRRMLKKLKPDRSKHPRGLALLKFDALRDLLISLTRESNTALDLGIIVALMAQAMRREGLKCVSVRDACRYAYDIPESDVIKMLEWYVRAGLARWPEYPGYFANISPDTVFELVD